MKWRLQAALALLLAVFLVNAHAASRSYTLYISAGSLTSA